MNFPSDYFLYSTAFAAVVGVVFAFRRDRMIRQRNMAVLGCLKPGIPASTSYEVAAAQMDEYLTKIQPNNTQQDPYGTHLSVSTGDPHFFWGADNPGPPSDKPYEP